MGKWGGGGIREAWRRALAVVRACFGYESRGSRSVAVQILKPGRAPSRGKGKATAARAPGPTLSDFLRRKLEGRGATVQAGAVEKASFAAHALTFFRSMGFEKDALLIARLFRGTGR